MEEETRMAKLALIADDLTGAADSGVQFAKRGFSTVLLVDREPVGDAEVVIVDTETRADPPQIARAKVHDAASSLPSVELIYKKIDSTLRGNVGVELEAIMEARCIERAVVAPAFPTIGRTTVKGRQLLNGQPLEETAFAQDPLCPITDSHIPTLLGRQMGREVGLVELALVREGIGALAAAMRERGEAVLVVDAMTEGDLRAIACAADQADLARLTCGSAGLAEAVAEVILPRHVAATTPETLEGATVDAPVLIVAASRNPLSGLQLSRAAREMGLAVLCVDTEGLALDASAEIGRLVTQAGKRLSAGHSVALSAVDSPYVAGLSSALTEALGEMAVQLVGQHALAGLVLTGGDVAHAVCRALRARALSLIGEIAPGIPLGRICGGPQAGLPLVTKAGGFGQEEAIITAIRRLQGTTPLSLQF